MGLSDGILQRTEEAANDAESWAEQAYKDMEISARRGDGDLGGMALRAIASELRASRKRNRLHDEIENSRREW